MSTRDVAVKSKPITLQHTKTILEYNSDGRLTSMKCVLEPSIPRATRHHIDSKGAYRRSDHRTPVEW